jgi:hypothetical protein
MIKMRLLIILLAIPGFAQAQGEHSVQAFFTRQGVPKHVMKQVIARYAPGSGTPSKVSRLKSLSHGYVTEGGSLETDDSAYYSYSNGRGGDLNSAHIDFDKLTTYEVYGQLYEHVLTQSFNKLGRVDTLLSSARWDKAPFYNLYRELYWYNILEKDSLMLFQTWNYGILRDARRVSTSYNPSGAVSGILTEEWYYNLNRWDSSERTTNTYDASGRLVDSLIERGYVDTAQRTLWYKESRHAFTYDASGNQTSWTSVQDDTGGYRNFRRLIYHYDAANVFTGQVYEEGRTVGGNTIISRLDSFSLAPHPADPRIPVFTEYYWSSTGWKATYRASALFSGTGNIVISLYEFWDGAGWMNGVREWYYYNSYDQLIRYFDESWHDNDWRILQRNREHRYYYEPFQSLEISRHALNTSSLTLFPVPAGDALTMAIGLEEAQHISVQITDAGGRKISSWNEHMPAGLYTRDIDTRSLPAGTYFLSIRSGQGSAGKAFTVQH